MKIKTFSKIIPLVLLISMIYMNCENDEISSNIDSESKMEKENDYTDKPELKIRKLLPIPQSIEFGDSTQVTLSVESDCPPITPEEIHHKCHDDCNQFLDYTWTSSCAGSFDDKNIEDPIFTPAPDITSGICTLSVLIKNKCTQLKASSPIFIINEPPKILSSFQSTDIIMTGQQNFFIIRAKDPEGTALSFSWSSTSGTFSEPLELNNEEYTESFIEWTSPDCGEELINVTVDITDEDGLVSKKTYLPITLIDGEACQ